MWGLRKGSLELPRDALARSLLKKKNSGTLFPLKRWEFGLRQDLLT